MIKYDGKIVLFAGLFILISSFLVGCAGSSDRNVFVFASAAGRSGIRSLRSGNKIPPNAVTKEKAAAKNGETIVDLSVGSSFASSWELEISIIDGCPIQHQF